MGKKYNGPGPYVARDPNTRRKSSLYEVGAHVWNPILPSLPAKTLTIVIPSAAMSDDVKNDECALPPSKRKPDSCLLDADDSSKKLKTEIEMPGEPLASEVEEEDDDDDQEEHSNGEAEIDRKGKGIMIRDDKGKGKMVQEDESDDEDDNDDDSSDDDDYSSDEEDDSDLSDDPLDEVDLDNILPSRTRRRAVSYSGISLGKNAAADKDNRAD
ncbi:hypothetical protein QQ045_008527 [Rhodiola kirilowii]